MTDTLIVAITGFAGVLVGAVSSLGGQILVHKLKEKAEAKKDKPRKELLKTLLNDQRYSWRKLDTLMHVIGADEETTQRLLLELDARASEDGQDLWGLISRNPLTEQ